MFKPLIKKEEDREVNVPPKVPSKMISMEDAHQMAEEAAELATQKSMESFNRFQEQSQIKEQRKEVVTQDPLDEPMVFDKGAFRSVSNTMRAIKSMQEVFTPPPSKIEQAVQNVVENVSTDIATKMLGGGSGRSGSSMIMKGIGSSLITDVLNTAFGHGLGESLGAGGAESIKTLITSLSGQGNTKQLSGGEKTNQSEVPDSSNAEKQKDMVLALDLNNPEHIKQYSTAMGLSEKAAKEMLAIHQNDIINERKMSGAPSGSNNEMNQVTQALTVLINEMSGMKNTIINLNDEIINLKGERIKSPETLNTRILDKWNDENEKITSSPESRQVNLFQEPIRVDVDEIRGENLKDSFFDDKQPIKEAEIIDKNVEKKDNKNKPLEQVIDEKGDSHFETLGSEDNKKKESDVVETQQLINNTPKVEREAEQETKQEIEISNQNRVQRKRMIRKVIIKKDDPIKEEPVKEEFQDITNNNKIVSDEKTVNNEEVV